MYRVYSRDQPTNGEVERASGPSTSTNSTNGNVVQSSARRHHTKLKINWWLEREYRYGARLAALQPDDERVTQHYLLR